MKDIKQFIQITSGIAEPLRQGFLTKIDELENKLVIMTKEEAIAFAKKYMGDRKRKGTDETNPEDPYWTWKIATECILFDIIPYLYGEALD